MATAISSTSVSVMWTSPETSNGDLEYYLISFYSTEQGRDDIQEQNTSVAVTSAILSGLRIFTNYTVFVRAFTVEFGPESEEITVMTQEDGKILKLMHSLIASTLLLACIICWSVSAICVAGALPSWDSSRARARAYMCVCVGIQVHSPHKCMCVAGYYAVCVHREMLCIMSTFMLKIK